MTEFQIVILCIISLLLSIALGYKLKQNTGLIALVFAYLIGCFAMGMSVSEVISKFSVKIFFMLFSVCMFYGYAIANGTLQAIADRFIYYVRNYAKLLPFLLFLISMFLASIGAGAPAVSAFMAPICFMIARKTHIHNAIIAALVLLGASAGSYAPWSQSGVLMRGIMEENMIMESYFPLSLHLFKSHMLSSFLTFGIVYLIFGGYRAQPLKMEKPEKFTAVQKKTLVLLVSASCFILLPPILNTMLPNAFFHSLVKYCDIQMIAIVGCVFCAVLHIGDEKKIIKSQVPWNVILMVCGISALLGVAQEAGAVDLMAAAIGSASSPRVIALLCVGISGFMSFFTGGITVVVPMLFPIVLSIAAGNPDSMALLLAATGVGAVSTSLSPFSTGGSVILACAGEENEKGKLFVQQFGIAVLNWIVVAFCAVSGLFS